MNFALSRMIMPVSLVIGLGLTGCTVMTKQEHLELHKQLQEEMMSSEAHKNMMQEMMSEMMKMKKMQ